VGRDNELFKLSGNDIREYFKFSVRMSAKPSTGSYTILIDDTQRPKLLVLVLIVPDARKGLKAIIFLEKKKTNVRCKRKGMEGLQPSMISISTIFTFTRHEFDWSHSCSSSIQGGCESCWFEKLRSEVVGFCKSEKWRQSVWNCCWGKKIEVNR